ncbi:MAG: hypothetical protein OXE99_10125 [Cellvibrionales bacterium]|nr:hypothetical protein [Cellvibrionales bacterium]
MKYKQQGGQALVEYVVGVTMLVAILFTPMPNAGGKNAVELLNDAFKKNYRGYEYVMSQPSGE